jgi:hypothetical protein
LPAPKFIRRFLQHVLPDGFMRIRHYGFLANRAKKQALARCREHLHAPPLDPETPKTTAEWILELTGVDISRCPQCGGLLSRRDLKPSSQPSPVPLPTRTTAPPIHHPPRGFFDTS